MIIIFVTLLIFIVLVIVSIIFIIGFKTNGRQFFMTATSSPRAVPLYTGKDDDPVQGIIQPYFCSGNPFSSGNTKLSFTSFMKKFGPNLFTMPNTIDGVKVFGVGDQNGVGWLGGDSAASIQLSNGDLLFVFGDSFLSKIDAPNVWLSMRDTGQITMPHNSLSYLKVDKSDRTKIKQNIFFIGQSEQNVSNSFGLGFDTECPFEYTQGLLQKYRSSPYFFNPNGCESFIQPRGENIPKDANVWLMGGMCQKSDIAILSSVVQGIKNIGTQFIEVQDAINKNGLAKNPFLWDKDPTTRFFNISDELTMNNTILYQKIMKDADGMYVVIGSRNKKPGVEIYLFRGTYNQILQQNNIQVWNGRWNVISNRTKTIELKPIEIRNDILYGTNYYCEFYFSEKENTYCFFSISTDENKNKILYKYKSVSKKIEGPYDIDDTFIYSFPQWINNMSDQLDVYSLRSHPGLNRIVQNDTNENVEIVLSYVVQGIFPQYSGNFFNINYSTYNIYYPQFIIITY